jgi:hypothetical protein
MRIRTIALSGDIDLRKHLWDAELAVDACSDEELELLENDLVTSIQGLVSQRPNLRVARTGPKAAVRKVSPKYAVSAFMGLLVAAAALFLLQNSELDKNSLQPQSHGRWQVKGPADGQTPESFPRCNVIPLQPESVSVEITDTGYQVDPALPVYLKSVDCSTKPLLQALDNGSWVAVGSPYTTAEGFLMQGGKLADFRPYAGKTLRVQSEEGLSEEFILIEKPQR